MDTFLEILKYSVPALIVFATVYFIMKRYLDQQYAIENLRYKQKHTRDSLPLKLQAYERIMLLCERISIPNLTYRISHKTMNIEQLQTAMMIAVQQEYEHNLTQQIYISDKLWQIVTLAKDQVIQIITKAAEGMEANDPPAKLLERAQHLMDSINMNPIDQARAAIKNEINILI